MNIIVICIDTLRWDHVGANCSGRVRTPNIDRLAARSWRFDRAFAASFPTIPHRTDALTGRYGGPFHAWMPLRFDAATLPRVLADAGYCTQLIHDTPHLVNGGHAFDYAFNAWSFIRGAEVDREWITGKLEPMANWRREALFDLIREDPLGTALARTYCRTNRGRRRGADWNVAKLFAAVADWLKHNARRDRFFLWVDCFDPHEPWDAPPEFVRRYDKRPRADGRIDPRAFLVRSQPDLPPAVVECVRAHYAAKVTFMDRWLGRMLDALDATRLWKNTAVVLTSDHGTRLYERGVFGKGHPVLEEVAHVPFFVAAPGQGAGRSDVIVQPQDLFATVASLAGVRPPGEIDSHDVLAQARSGRGRRNLALTGRSAQAWRENPKGTLFTVYDAEWCLEFRLKPKDCPLCRLGSTEDVARENPRVVARLHSAAVDEIARRGADPRLVAWLRAAGRRRFPATCRPFDGFPIPPGWQFYWNRTYRGK
jgi:arylsulfatase A-like enzyme